MVRASHVLSAACVVAAMLAMPAQAAIVQTNGTYTVESPPVTEETSVKLFMNEAKGVTQGTAFYGQNNSSLPGFPTFNITTTDPVNFASGFAQVTGPNNDLFHSLTVSANDTNNSNWLFHDILFATQVNFTKEGTGKDATKVGDLQIWVNGIQQFSFDETSGLLENQLQNWLLFDSDSAIKTITLTSTSGFVAVKFLEISGLANRGDDPGQVPLPAAVLLFGSVLAGGAGLTAFRRRRKFAA